MLSIAQRVKNKRDELVQHIAQLEQELLLLQEKQALIVELLGKDGGVVPVKAPRKPGPGKQRAADATDASATSVGGELKRGRGKRKAARKARYNGRPIREVILEILARGGAPMPAKDISAALKEQGIDVAVNTVFTSLKQLRTQGAVATHEHQGPGAAFALAPR